MADESEIFQKPKEKRKLTQKQLDALARGRAKQAEKRKLALEKQDKKEKNEIDGVKKEKKKEKKVRMKEQEILERVKVRESEKKKEEKRNKALEEWDTIRCQALEKCTTYDNFKHVESILDEVDDDTACDKTKLGEFFRNKHSLLTKNVGSETTDTS